MTGVIAAPIAVSKFKETGSSSAGAAMRCGAPIKNIPHPTSIAIATILSVIKAFCTLLPARTPRQLTIVNNPNASAATAWPLREACVISRK